MAQTSPEATSSTATIKTETDGAEVSVFIDGDKKLCIRSSDLEAIGEQLRGKKKFSLFNYIFLPIGISVLTVIGTTLVTQTFQYVSWRNATTLQQVVTRPLGRQRPTTRRPQQSASGFTAPIYSSAPSAIWRTAMATRIHSWLNSISLCSKKGSTSFMSS